MWEKRNVAEDKRTPREELERRDEHWDKQAADEFKPVKSAAKSVKKSGTLEVR